MISIRSLINHNLGINFPATPILSPVIYYESEEHRNFTKPAISEGTPKRFKPYLFMTYFYPDAQRGWLNPVFIIPGQTQLTRI